MIISEDSVIPPQRRRVEGCGRSIEGGRTSRGDGYRLTG